MSALKGFILTMRIIILFSFLFISTFGSSGKDKPTASSNASVEFQREFLTRVNQLRTSGCKCGKTYMPPVAPLSWNSLLEYSASKHARDMEQRRFFSHVNPSGKSVKHRIEEADYTLTGMSTYAYGENIAMGQRSIQEVMNGWIKSEGHCKNLMNKNFEEIGVARNNRYWVQNFGMHKSRSNQQVNTPVSAPVRSTSKNNG